MKQEEILAAVIKAVAETTALTEDEITQDTKIFSIRLPQLLRVIEKSLGVRGCSFRPEALVGPLTVGGLVNYIELD